MELHTTSNLMYAVLTYMKKKTVASISKSGNFNPDIFQRAINHGLAARYRQDGSLQLGVATSVKQNGDIKLPFAEQRTMITSLNIFDIPPTGPVGPVMNALKKDAVQQPRLPHETKILGTLKTDFASGVLSMPDSLRGVDITKIDVAAKAYPAHATFMFDYIHELQYKPMCNHLNNAFLNLINDAPTCDKMTNIENATELQKATQIAMANTPINFTSVHGYYKRLDTELELFKRAQ
jgi:hypothetical protein